MIDLLRGAFGILLLVVIAWLFSENRKNISWRLAGIGLLLQVVFGVLILKGGWLRALWTPLGYPKDGFDYISQGFVKLLDFTGEGARFVFGSLAIPPGNEGSLGYFFVFQTLITIVFFSSLIAVLYHLGVMQWIVRIIAWIMAKTMRISGAESLSVSADIFVGMVEAPLFVRPYLEKMTRSELFTLMVGGLATIAGGVMAAYVQMLGLAYSEVHGIADGAARAMFAAHLLGASVMSAPAAIVLSKIMLPETLVPETYGSVRAKMESSASNIIDAATQGAADGVKLAINVAAMLVAFISLVALVNYLLGAAGDATGLNRMLEPVFHKPLSLQLLFGLVFQYIAVGIGIPWHDAFHVGSLIGTKITLNEFVAYLDLARMIRTGVLTSEKTLIMASFALCGFANFGSVAILIGGLGPLAPGQRNNLTALSMRALLAGVLTTLMTATIAGALVSL